MKKRDESYTSSLLCASCTTTKNDYLAAFLTLRTLRFLAGAFLATFFTTALLTAFLTALFAFAFLTAPFTFFATLRATKARFTFFTTFFFVAAFLRVGFFITRGPLLSR